jgi:hypothetical protein
MMLTRHRQRVSMVGIIGASVTVKQHQKKLRVKIDPSRALSSLSALKTAQRNL